MHLALPDRYICVLNVDYSDRKAVILFLALGEYKDQRGLTFGNSSLLAGKMSSVLKIRKG